MSTTVIKSVPSPGSPSQTPSGYTSWGASCASLWEFIFSWSCWISVLSWLSASESLGNSFAENAASGTKFSSETVGSSWIVVGFSTSGVASCATGSCSWDSCSFNFFSSSCFSICARSSSSFFVLRPLCLGIFASCSSAVISLSLVEVVVDSFSAFFL